MAGRDWSEKSDSSIEEKLCVCVGRRVEARETDMGVCARVKWEGI